MIGQFILQYGVLGAKGVGVILGAWLIWYLITNFVKFFRKCGDKFIDKMDKSIDETLKVGNKNMELNKEIAIVLKETHEDIIISRKDTKIANKEIKENQKIQAEILRNILTTSNGSNPKFKEHDERLEKLEKI